MVETSQQYYVGLSETEAQETAFRLGSVWKTKESDDTGQDMFFVVGIDLLVKIVASMTADEVPDVNTNGLSKQYIVQKLLELQAAESKN